jgi:hypothetical protein
MTWKDKLEIGLKNDAPFRKDNLPESQVRGPEIPAGPGRSPIIPAAIEDAENPVQPTIPDDREPMDEQKDEDFSEKKS